MGQKIAGTCYVKIDGDQLLLKGGIEVPINKVKREIVMANNKPAGFKETPQEPYIKGTFIMGLGFPLAKLRDSTEMTITAELVNGTVYTLSQAWLDGEATLKTEDGEIDMEFKGMDGVFQ